VTTLPLEAMRVDDLPVDSGDAILAAALTATLKV
jgi:hypothetical protein